MSSLRPEIDLSSIPPPLVATITGTSLRKKEANYVKTQDRIARNAASTGDPPPLS